MHTFSIATQADFFIKSTMRFVIFLLRFCTAAQKNNNSIMGRPANAEEKHYGFVIK